MLTVKKLIFAPVFLVFLSLFLFFLNQIYSLPVSSLFSFEVKELLPYLYASIFLLLTSLAFVIFGALAQDYKIVSPVAVVAAILPAILLSSPLGFVLAVGLLVILVFNFSLLFNSLKSYLTFKPTALLMPAVKSLTLLIIILSSVGYYLNANDQIQKNGFEIPDSLIETVLKYASPQTSEGTQVKGQKYIAQISQDQINYLKSHPELLKQYNVDPKILDSLKPTTKTTSSTSKPQAVDLPKQLIKDQVQTLTKPIQKFIAPIMALLFYFSLSFVVGLLALLLPPLLWLIFRIFEKSGFIKFTTEMREVKKMVV